MALKMVQCRRVESIRLEINSKDFHELELHNFDLLNDLQINSNLLSLNISGCSSLTDDNTHITCPSLQVFDICGTSLSNRFYKDVEELGKCLVKRGSIELPTDFDDMMIYI